MLPHEKQMVVKLKDQPFALIGINSDGGRSALLKILKEQKITWRQAVDGDTHGPLATQWNVHYWPHVFVLDAKGVIRSIDERDEKLEEVVVKLLKEMKVP